MDLKNLKEKNNEKLKLSKTTPSDKKINYTHWVIDTKAHQVLVIIVIGNLKNKKEF